jgi:transposase-like protein
MKRRTWDSRTKAKIVLEGLSGRTVAELCTQHQISQNQYYQWRDKFVSEAYRAFETVPGNGELTRWKVKTARLQQIIGALTVELKKSEDELL